MYLNRPVFFQSQCWCKHWEEGEDVLTFVFISTLMIYLTDRCVFVPLTLIIAAQPKLNSINSSADKPFGHLISVCVCVCVLWLLKEQLSGAETAVHYMWPTFLHNTWTAERLTSANKTHVLWESWDWCSAQWCSVWTSDPVYWAYTFV